MLLGFLDSSIQDFSKYDSFFGGHPLTLNGELITSDLITCQQCSRKLTFVCQLYCPLATQCYHRNIYFFACCKEGCFNKQGSWAAIRQIRFDSELDSNISDDLSFLNIDDDSWTQNENYTKECFSNVEKSTEERAFDENKSGEAIFFKQSAIIVYLPSHDDVINDIEIQSKIKDLISNDTCEEDDDNLLTSLSSIEYDSFIAEINKDPGQIIRYDWKGTPLHLREEEIPVDVCEYCGSCRVFELQILPTLIHYMRGIDNNTCIEFGNVILYSCSKSCNKGPAFKREFLHIQQSDDTKT